MPAETAEFVGRGFPVEIGKIDRELKNVWKEGEGAMTRASLINFAIYSDLPGAFERNTDFIGEFTQDHACRAIVISANPRETQNRVLAWISAHCHVSRAGAKQVCCEQISFQLDGPSSKLIPNIVFSHLDSDLPLVFWWQGQIPDPIDDTLWKWIDRLIVDSAEWTEPAAEFHRLRASIEESDGRTTLCDLNWTRTFHLRDAIAHLFDYESVLKYLNTLDTLEVDHAPGARLTAMLVAGWFALQLGWTLEELGSSASTLRFTDAQHHEIKVRFNEVEGNVISRVHGQRGTGYFDVVWKPGANFLETSVQVPHEHCVRSRMMPASQVDQIDLVSDELSRGGRHKLYLRVLNFLDPVLPLAKV